MSKEWRLWQTTAKNTDQFAGCSLVLWWSDELLKAADDGSAFVRGQKAWGRQGVACRQMRNLSAAYYLGNLFDTNIAVIVPNSTDDLPATQRLDFEREIDDERKHDPPIHAERAALARHRHEMLRVGEIAAQPKHDVGADVVVRVDDHGLTA